jgi:cytochrome c peroxidase
MMKMKSRPRFQRLIRLLLLTAFAGLSAWLLFAVDRPAAAQERAAGHDIPLGLPADTWSYYVPKDNPLTPARIELGRKLFFDARLSADGKISCATCHKPEQGFADGKPVAEGIGGKLGTRNSPSLLNAMFNPGQFWDGRTNTLEEQAIQPLVNPLEMGEQTHEQIVKRLRDLPDYVAEFQRVFNAPLTIERVGQAIAAYERTLVAGEAPLDRYLAGDQRALSEAAQRGFVLFRGQARCTRCHTFTERLPFFTDFDYHNTGVAARHPAFARLAKEALSIAEQPNAKALIDKLALREGGQELGRMLVSYQILDLGSYRTPSLRNIALTAPYFHDGSAKTLADVVRFYNEGGKDNPNLHWDLLPLDLAEDAQRDLVAFLESLTGKLPETK